MNLLSGVSFRYPALLLSAALLFYACEPDVATEELTQTVVPSQGQALLAEIEAATKGLDTEALCFCE